MHHGPRGPIGRAFRHPSLLPALLTLSLSFVPGSRTSAADRSGPAREGDEGPRVTATTSGARTSERMKLAAARAAVERARAAGTLFRTQARRADVTPLPSDWAARKRELLRALGPKPFPDDPAAGVGVLPSVQKRGPAELSAAEEAKRRALPSSSSKDREPNQAGR